MFTSHTIDKQKGATTVLKSEILENALRVLKKSEKFTKIIDTSLYHFPKGFVDIVHSF